MSVIQIMGYAYFGIAVLTSLAAITSMVVGDKRLIKKLKATRDELNRRLAETGSPARYELQYSDWEWVESYGDSAEESAIGYMERVLKAYNEYLATGGDPKEITDVDEFFKRRKEQAILSEKIDILTDDLTRL